MNTLYNELIDIIKRANKAPKAFDTDFNLFQLFWAGETKNSEILAYLLNPESNHGLGKKLLFPFLEKLGIPEPGTGDWQVTCEREKVDVMLVREAPKSIVVIENKSDWAVDQPNQLYRYFYNSICKRLGADEVSVKYIQENTEHFKIVYLPPNALKPPDKQSITCPEDSYYSNIQRLVPDLSTITGLVVQWTFDQHIFKWLEHCHEIAKVNTRVADFIAQYREYWEKKLLWNSTLDMESQINLRNTVITDKAEDFIQACTLENELSMIRKEVFSKVTNHAINKLQFHNDIRIAPDWHLEVAPHHFKYEGFLFGLKSNWIDWKNFSLYLIENTLYLTLLRPTETVLSGAHELIHTYDERLREMGFEPNKNKTHESLRDKFSFWGDDQYKFLGVAKVTAQSEVLKKLVSPQGSDRLEAKLKRIHAYSTNGDVIFNEYRDFLEPIFKNEALMDLMKEDLIVPSAV